MRLIGRYFKCALAAGATGAVILAAPHNVRANNFVDHDITRAVERNLYMEKAGGGSNGVNVSTENGIVTIRGTVPSITAEKEVVGVVQSTRGVAGIVDLVSVTPERRSDGGIRKDVEAALRRDPVTRGDPVSVWVFDGVVHLTGKVGSYPEKSLAERLAGSVPGVRRVQNGIAINYLTRRTDAEIAADIRSRFQWDVWLEGSDIQVNVNKGDVTLTGTVRNAIGQSRAYEDAWVNGVVAVADKGLRVVPGAGLTAGPQGNPLASPSIP